MEQALAVNSQEQLRAYFDGVLALYKSGERYPVNLDDVWPLAYSSKFDAVRSLKNNFEQGLDYQVSNKNAENPQGGRPTDVYSLTTECLEYLIARKVREVFNVYRTVFKKVATGEVAVLPKDYASALRELADQVERNERLLLENKQQSCQIAEMSKAIDAMQPKADYYDMILNNKSTVLVTQIAQDYGMSAKAFNKMLADMGVQRKVGGQWILYAPHYSNGYVQSKPITITRTNGVQDVKYLSEWTQKGRLFLYDLLKENGILPLIEQ